jgi:acyl-CoA thioesterase-2
VQSDLDLLGLVATGEPGRYRFVVEPHLSRPDARLYGGTAIAVSVASAEVLTGRQVLWMTTQFVASIPQGETVDVHTEVLAPGRRTNQVRVTGSAEDGSIVFASLGATGEPRDDGLEGSFERMPVVAPPEASPGWKSPFSVLAEAAGHDVDSAMRKMPLDAGMARLIELRTAAIDSHPDGGPGRVSIWARRRDGEPITPTTAAFIADTIPLAVSHALGVVAGGTSLDNTVRFGRVEPTEWMLIDMRAHGAVGGYGHGVAHLWTPEGAWLGVASQTASMRTFSIAP